MTDPPPEVNAESAREQLGLVRSVLEHAGKRQRPAPFTYIAWGLASAIYYLAYTPSLASNSDTLVTIAELLTVVAYGLTIGEFFRARRERATMLDRQALAVFAGVTTVLWTLKILWSSSNLVDGPAFGIMWTLGFAIALLVHGSGPLRPLLVGGILLVVAVVVGSLAPVHLTLTLAIGNFIGIAGPGLYFLVRRE